MSLFGKWHILRVPSSRVWCDVVQYKFIDIPLKCWWNSTRKHGITFQKTVIFIDTAVRMSDPIYKFVCCVIRYLQISFRRELGYENAPKWHICCSVDENVNIIFHSIFPVWTVRLEFWINEVLSFAGINDNFKFKINPFVLSFSLKKMVPLFGCMFSW